MSPERPVVDEAAADAFVAKLAVKAEGLLAGGPRGHVVLGSLIDQSAATSMEDLITDAAGKGAVVAIGGKWEGSVFHATILDRDVTRALAVSRRLETGICHINGPTVADEAQMPFDSVKASGCRRFGGKTEISEFTNLRRVTIE